MKEEELKKQGNASNLKNKKRRTFRIKNPAKFQMTEDADISYKNLALLQKFLNARGKMIPRRISGVSSKIQRQLASAIKRARFLALLTTGGVKR